LQDHSHIGHCTRRADQVKEEDGRSAARAEIAAAAIDIHEARKNTRCPMNSQQLTILAIVLLVGAGIFAFAAIERYSANAGNVAAMNGFMQAVPLGPSLGVGPMEPGVPAATKYCALGAAICGVGGLIALAQARRRPQTMNATQ
jgi:hypothetical protein